MFLLPFVAIRVVSGDRQSNALKLELRQRMSPFTRVLAKALVLLAGWLISGGAAIAAIGLWKLYGGATYAGDFRDCRRACDQRRPHGRICSRSRLDCRKRVDGGHPHGASRRAGELGSSPP